MRFIRVCCVAVFLSACAPSQTEEMTRYVSPEHTIQNGVIVPTPSQALPAVNASCAHITTAESNTIFSYHDQKRGVTFEMPFNVDWKESDGTPLLPAQDSFGDVIFGARRYGYNATRDLCIPERDFTYAVQPKRTAAQAERSYESEQVVDPKNVTIEQLGNYQAVVMDKAKGECISPAIEVIGIRENILFTLSCEAQKQLQHPLQEMKKIVRTLEIEKELL